MIFKKYLYIILGLTLALVGSIGIFLPGIPTTFPLIISLWFFSRSSKKFESWLLNHRRLGKFLTNWKKYKAINFKAKIQAIISIILTFLITIYMAFSGIIDLIFLCFGFLLCIFIATRPEPPKIDYE